MQGADALLPEIVSKIKMFLADKAYDALDRVLKILYQYKVEPVIPSKLSRKVQREYDVETYKSRHLIENFFAKIKQYRAIATRYDKTAKNFLGGVHLIASLVLLN